MTYAELTLPRKQGYTILRRVSPSSATTPPSSSAAAVPGTVVGAGPLSTSSSSSSAGPSVIYARIEKPQQPLSLLVAPHGMAGLGSAPLGSGGGVSPSSFMNTSCDSSTSSATTTRFGIVHQKPRYTDLVTGSAQQSKINEILTVI